MIIDKIWICDRKHFPKKKIDWSYNNVYTLDYLLWSVFHVTILICVFLRQQGIVFVFQALENYLFVFFLC